MAVRKNIPISRIPKKYLSNLCCIRIVPPPKNAIKVSKADDMKPSRLSLARRRRAQRMLAEMNQNNHIQPLTDCTHPKSGNFCRFTSDP